MAGLSPFWTVPLAVLLVVVLVVAGIALLREDTYEADAPPADARQPRPAAAAATLHSLVQVVQTRDDQRVTDLARADSATATAQLGAVVANAGDLGVADFTARYVDEVGATELDGSWQAAVDLTWRFAGFDERPARSEVVVTFAPEGQGAAIESIGGGGRRTPLWLRERLQVVRSSNALVAVAGSEAAARAHAGRVERAIPIVRRVLPGWKPSVVVEVPGSASDLDETLGVEPGTYAGIAAVTIPVDGSASSGAPVHVFVNPEVTDRLQRRGAQVVMSHELVHVATGAATSSVDVWLLEGFADYVALRDVPLPLETLAARAVELVARQGVPRALPGPETFDTQADDLEAAYELAWLAAREVADVAGERALVATYHAAQAGVPVGQALRRHADLSLQDLETRWQRRLRDLAG